MYVARNCLISLSLHLLRHFVTPSPKRLSRHLDVPQDLHSVHIAGLGVAEAGVLLPDHE
jgi:hypothetical protein